MTTKQPKYKSLLESDNDISPKKHQITNDWLLKYRTERGGYTKKQLNYLGIEWPPKKDWKEGIISTYIDIANARKFEKLSLPKGSESVSLLNVLSQPSAATTNEPIKRSKKVLLFDSDDSVPSTSQSDMLIQGVVY